MHVMPTRTDTSYLLSYSLAISRGPEIGILDWSIVHPNDQCIQTTIDMAGMAVCCFFPVKAFL